MVIGGVYNWPGEIIMCRFALAAAIFASILCLIILIRSPRNVFTGSLVAIMACLAEWNLFEFLREVQSPEDWPEDWSLNVQFVGISYLAAVSFHFSVLFIENRRRRQWLLIPAYVLATACALVPIVGLHSGGENAINDFFQDPIYNYWLLGLLGPLMIGSLALIGRLWWTAKEPMRGVFGGFLLAALVGVVTGVVDLSLGIHLANLGAIVACVIYTYCALRHRDVFDSISRVRTETRSLFERTRRGFVRVGRRGEVIACNDLAIDFLGAAPTSLEEIDPALESIRQQGGQKFLSRGPRVLKATLVPSSNVSGEVTWTCVILEDATREYELLHEHAQRESLASLGEAAATLAHEIKNPLTAIGVTAESLDGDAEGDREGIARIRGEVKRLNALLGRSLSLARPLELDRQSTDLDRLIRRSLELAGHTERITYRSVEDLPKVRLDPELIRQVLLNLVKNAEEAGAETISLETSRDDEVIRIRVRNDGPAIPPDVLGRLFQPFVTTKSKGTGLGLALCRKVLLAHGGEIVARNVAEGVEFEMSIPWTS